MSKLSEELAEALWQEDSIRAHGKRRSTSWDEISDNEKNRFRRFANVALSVFRAHETGASGVERMREKAADLAGSIWPRGGAHTYASENADRYYALEDASEAIAAAIRALPTDGE